MLGCDQNSPDARALMATRHGRNSLYPSMSASRRIDKMSGMQDDKSFMRSVSWIRGSHSTWASTVRKIEPFQLYACNYFVHNRSNKKLLPLQSFEYPSLSLNIRHELMEVLEPLCGGKMDFRLWKLIDSMTKEFKSTLIVGTQRTDFCVIELYDL